MYISGFASMQSLRASLPSVSMHRLSEQQVKSSKSSIINTESSITKEKLVEMMRSTQQQNVVSMYSNSTNMQENFAFGKVSKQEFIHSEDSDTMVKESAISSMNRTEVCSVQSDDSVFTTKLTRNSDEPPALPVKTRTRSTRKERHISQYDNVEELDSFSRYGMLVDIFFFFCQTSDSYFVVCSAQLGRLNFPEIRHMQSKHQSLIEQRRVNHFDDNEQPPPLPVKKKHSKSTHILFLS